MKAGIVTDAPKATRSTELSLELIDLERLSSAWLATF
jgi:hypothetical protein